MYLTAGYTYLQTGDYRMNAEHPPLAKLLAALPLRLLRPDLPVTHPTWAQANLHIFARQFLFTNRVPADRMLFAARLVSIGLTAILGLALAIWTRRHFGSAAALLALFLFVTDPNFLAHGRLVTNDVPVTLFMFLAVVAWSRFLARKGFLNLTMAGVALSLALLTKFSAVLLLPIFVALYLIRAWQEEGETGPKLSVERFFASALVMGTMFVGLTCCAYQFRPRLCTSGGGLAVPCTLREAVAAQSRTGRMLLQAARAFHLPDHPYLVGFFMQSGHQESGHTTYLLGQRSETGWWYYMPVAFAVKTPTVVLALLFAAAVMAALWLFRREPVVARLRRLPFPWIAAILPAALYGAVAMSSRVALGIRYLLPVYPFLFVLAGAVVFRVLVPRAGRFAPYLLAAILITQGAESAASYPGHLAFFNTISGGPARGHRYLLDSNLDWGQDLKRLKRYLDRTGTRTVCLYYFGTSPAAYYGIQERNLPTTTETADREKVDCIAAISLTPLNDLYLPPGYDFSWLRNLSPIAKAGESIWIYDLRRVR